MEAAMSKSGTSLFLRRILIADAVISGATGLLMAFGADALQELLGVPATLLRYAGWSLVPFAILVASLSRQEAPPRAGVLTVIGLNAAWVAASVLLLLPGWIHPNGLGYAFVVGQAVAVGVLAEMQYAGLRRSSGLAA
jgi:hypothetical protein